MKIFITAKPNSKKPKVEKIDETHFVVHVKEPPVKGQANKAIIKALADFLNYPPYQLEIISGHILKNKVIQIT